jgi:micrococcal nuclease
LVTKIIDGDTIRVSVRGKSESVRLLSIDTPETKDPRKPVQCFGSEATKKMQTFVNGKYVRLVDDRSQGQRDKYQRLLRYAYDGNVFVNREMVAQGYAFSYKQYPTKYLNEFNKLEQQAREKNLGLWNKCQ